MQSPPADWRCQLARTAQAHVFASIRAVRYKPFFLRSAQRFFIAIDNRLLPSGVRPPRLFLFNLVPLGLPALVFLPPRAKADPRSAAIARPSLSLSSFKSATNLSRSKIRSFGALAICSSRRSVTARYDSRPIDARIGAHANSYQRNTYSFYRLDPIMRNIEYPRREQSAAMRQVAGIVDNQYSGVLLPWKKS
ncbi:MAG: hypothetical protein WB498_06210 [Candidatus Binatus sp.]